MEKQLKNRKRFTEQIMNLFANIRRFHWSSKDADSVLRDMYASREWKSLTIQTREYLRGQIDLLRMQIEKDTTPAYFIDGNFMTIGSDEYRKILPQTVHEKYGHTCAWVWKDDPQKVYSGYKEEMHVTSRLSEHSA